MRLSLSVIWSISSSRMCCVRLRKSVIWNVGKGSLQLSVKNFSWGVKECNCNIRKIWLGSVRWNCLFSSNSLVVTRVQKIMSSLLGVWVYICPNKPLSNLISNSSMCSSSLPRQHWLVVVEFSPVLCSNKFLCLISVCSLFLFLFLLLKQVVVRSLL